MTRWPWAVTAATLVMVVASRSDAAPPALPTPAELAQADDNPGPDQTPLDLQTALQWTLSRNPELIALRQNRSVSAAALAVAREFPMSLNPTVFVDVRPWTFERDTGHGSGRLENAISVSWMQPFEFGHRTLHRSTIARADYTKTQWEIVQAELLALVKTYRLHQTAVYRNEKLRVARQLAEFNARLVRTVRRQMEAGQVSAADLVLAEVENQSLVQLLQGAEQAYLDAVTELRKQLGLPEYATSLTPVGQLKLPEGTDPADEEDLMRIALQSHPEIGAAQARAAASHAAVYLARAERVPVVSVGPVYENDESGTTFYGFALDTPVPVLNAGKRLVHQREMEHSRDLISLKQLRLRISTQVKASLNKWNRTGELVDGICASTVEIESQADRMERLYTAGQTDLLKLLQVRQRLIEAENARLDLVWQAIEAYGDVLAATGATPLLGTLCETGI